MAAKRSRDFEAALRDLEQDQLASRSTNGRRAGAFRDALAELADDFDDNRREQDLLRSGGRRRPGPIRAGLLALVLTVAVSGAAFGGMAYARAAANGTDVSPAPITTVMVSPPVDRYDISVLPIGAPVDPAAQAAIDDVLQAYRDKKAQADADEKAAADAAAAAAAAAAKPAGGSTGGNTGGSTGGTSVPASPSIKSVNAQTWSGAGTVDIEVYVTTTGGAVGISASASIPGVGSVTLSGPGSLDGAGTYSGTINGIPPGDYTITIKVNDKTLHVNAPVY